MDVRRVLTHLGTQDTQLQAKAEELLRLSRLKVPSGLGQVSEPCDVRRGLAGNVGLRTVARLTLEATPTQGEVCRAVACVELAYEL
jgi:hypothetical protein